jgi:heptosyltransferase-2
VRATNWVGDAVMSLPALRALRERFPSARITILAMPWVAGLYGREPFCDALIPWTAARGWRDFSTRFAIARQLRELAFDCAIIFPNSFDSALAPFLAGIPRRVGFNRDARRWLLTQPIAPIAPGDTPPHQSFHYLELLRRAGLISELPAVPNIRLDAAAQARAAGRARFADLGLPESVIGVSPGAAFGPAKRWFPERFAEAALTVARRHRAGIAIFGAPDEVAVCDEVKRHVHSAGWIVRSFAGQTTLAEFIELAAACAVFLANDSGSMHVVSALGVPNVSIFGSTSAAATGPLGPHSRVLSANLHCSPCFKRECPFLSAAENLACLKAVPAAAAARAALDLLETDSSRS